MFRQFTRIRDIHFVGIGGVGMSGIAEILLTQSFRISGCDLKESAALDRLRQQGALIHTGHAPAHLTGVDLVVISSAVQAANPEVAAARQRGIPVIRRAEMLAELMRLKFGIAVAGTHGKTTTTSMAGLILAEAGLDPTIIVGGRVRYLDTNAKLGSSDYLVAEADEYDRSFLTLAPCIAVVTSLEQDHLDTYRDLDDIKDAFVTFASRVPFFGAVIVCLDEPNVLDILPKLAGKRIWTYGLAQQADLAARQVRFEDGGATCEVVAAGRITLGALTLKVPGMHNVKNALAAISIGLELEIPFDVCARGLAKFTGVARRFEVKGERDGILIVDDYAHHPTEVQATLDAARSGFKRRVVAVFQPHLYSRTRDFYREFGKAFFESDVLVVTEIYPAREQPIPGVSGELIASSAKEFGHKNVRFLSDFARVEEFLAGELRSGDLLVTLGAGDIYRVADAALAGFSRDPGGSHAAP